MKKKELIEFMDDLIIKAYEEDETNRVVMFEKIKNRDGFKYALTFNAILTFGTILDVRNSIVSGYKQTVSRLRDNR